MPHNADCCRLLVVAVLSVGMALLADLRSATASDLVTLVLDQPSYLYFEGNGAQVSWLASGTRIEFDTQQADDRWEMTLSPDNVNFPEVTYPDGSTGRWHLARPAIGSMTPVGEERCSMNLNLAIQPSEAPDGTMIDLVFVTESTSSTASGMVAAETGSRINASSGAVRLVAAGINSNESPIAPGHPFTVVLDGHLEPAPSQMCR